MSGHLFPFAGTRLRALPSGAPLWPDEGMLAVADLHLRRSARFARRAGALLPPSEVSETLGRLEADIAQ